MNGPGAPGVATPPTGPSAPGPAQQAGVTAQARVKLHSCAKLLAEIVGALKDELTTDEGKAALSALKTLAPFTPDVDAGLGQSQIMSLMAGQRGASPGKPNMLGGPKPAPRVMAGPPMRPGMTG